MLLGLYTRMQSMWLGLRSRFEDESGAVATEYALLLSLIALAIVAAAIALGTNIAAKLQESADCIASGAPC